MRPCSHCLNTDCGNTCPDCLKAGHTTPAHKCQACAKERDQQTAENVKNFGGGWYAQKRQDALTEGKP